MEIEQLRAELASQGRDLDLDFFYAGPLEDFPTRSQDLPGAFTNHFLGAAFLSFGPLLILAVEPRSLSPNFCFQTAQMQH